MFCTSNIYLPLFLQPAHLPLARSETFFHTSSAIVGWPPRLIQLGAGGNSLFEFHRWWDTTKLQWSMASEIYQSGKYIPIDGWNPASTPVVGKVVEIVRYLSWFSCIPSGCLGFQPSTVQGSFFFFFSMGFTEKQLASLRLSLKWLLNSGAWFIFGSCESRLLRLGGMDFFWKTSGQVCRKYLMMKRFHTWYEWTSLSNFKYRKHIFCTQDENEPLFVVFPTEPAPVVSGLFQNPWEFQSQMPQPQKDSQPSLLLSSNEGKSNLKE